MTLLLAASCLPWAAQAGKDAVPYRQSTPRIAYIQKVTPGFELRLLDLPSGKVQDLLHFNNPPDHLSVAQRGRMLLVFGDHALHVLDLQTQKEEEISSLPEPAISVKGYSNTGPEIAGYLADGSLAVVMRTDDRTSDVMFYLFQRTADGWKALETSEGCGYYRECPPKYGFKHVLDARGLSSDVFDPSPSPIMVKAVEQNPFFLSRSERSSTPDPETGGNDEEHVIVFDFGASRSSLVYETQPDPDSGPDYMSSLSLEVPGQKPQVLCEGQCGGEIVGRYLLEGRVIDLSSGKVLLDGGNDPLNRIMEMGWVY